MEISVESVVDRILLAGAIAFAAYLYVAKHDAQQDFKTRQERSDAKIDSIANVAKSYADSAKTWRELAKDCDLTVDSLNQVLSDIGRRKLQVKRDVESAPDSALIKMFYDNLYSDE